MINTPFVDLSDAAKLYAIQLSGIFECKFDHPTDGSLQMVYVKNQDGLELTYTKSLQKLMDGKAEGKCSVYADYENIIFNALGFESYIIYDNYTLTHAWTVVRVKNNSGKELWVPFDYGIGPAPDLDVREEVRKKYLATEEMRYAYYLSVVPGDPNYKNFTLDDFFK